METTVHFSYIIHANSWYSALYNIQRFKIQSSDGHSLEQATGTLKPTASGRPCYILCGDRDNKMTTNKNWGDTERQFISKYYGEHLRKSYMHKTLYKGKTVS